MSEKILVSIIILSIILNVFLFYKYKKEDKHNFIVSGSLDCFKKFGNDTYYLYEESLFQIYLTRLENGDISVIVEDLTMNKENSEWENIKLSFDGVNDYVEIERGR